MRSLSSTLSAALAAGNGAAIRYLVEITPAGGVTRYLCTREHVIGGTTYAAELIGIGAMYERIGAVGDLQLTLFDSPANRTAVKLAADIKVKLWLVGDPIGSADTLFWGEISDPFSITGGRIRCDCVSRRSLHDQEIGDPIDVSDWPGADPDSIGRIKPLIYGAVDGCPAYAIDAGSKSTLISDVTASSTSLALSDAAAFPASGTIEIGEERITYTSKSGNTLLGCTRGASSTTAVGHAKGSTVTEIQSVYDYLVADHSVKQLRNVYVNGIRQPSGWSLVNEGGVAKIRFTNPAKIVRKVILANTDGIAVGATDTIGVTATTTANANTTASTTSTVPATVNLASAGWFYFPTISGTVTSAGMNVDAGNPYGVSGTNGYAALYAQAYNSVGAAVDSPKMLYRIDISGGLPTYYSNFSAQFVGAVHRVQLYWAQSGDVSGEAVVINNVQMAFVATATVSPNKTGTVTPQKTGTVTLGGNSVADAVIGVVTADVDGWADDGSGTITGTASAMIEKPNHIARHLLRQYGGATSVETAAADFPSDFGTEVLCMHIERVTTVRSLLNEIEANARAIVHYSGSRWRMTRRPSPGATPVVTLTDAAGAGDIVRNGDNGSSTIVESVAGLKQLRNRHRYRYGLIPSSQAWLGCGKVDDAASQTVYGLRKVQVDLPHVRSSSQASAIASWRSAREANPQRAIIHALLPIRHHAVEVGDVVRLNHAGKGIDITGDITAIEPRHMTGDGRCTMQATIEEF